MSYTVVYRKNAKLTLSGYDSDGNKIKNSARTKWVASSATYAQFGSDTRGSISGKTLYLNFDGGYLYLSK